ncbi:MAG: SPOR domain-containing protein [Polaribacter sp.]|nr:SPOR domain-containing protein [Polaribacter sp.]
MKIHLIFFSFLFIVCVGSFHTSAQTTQSKEVTALVKKKRAYNKKNGFGFRVQLLYGEELAIRKVLKKFQSTYPSIQTEIKYDEPYWKAFVGEYKTRLEADKALNLFKKGFSSAIVVPR